MALILPLLVMLVFGIIEFGRYYNASLTVTHASREAVRKVALSSGNAVTAGKNAASPLPQILVTVTTVPCPSGSAGATANAEATVGYPFTIEIPLVGSRNVHIYRTARMKCGG